MPSVPALQITPAAAQSGAFYRLLKQNHIALADATADVLADDIR